MFCSILPSAWPMVASPFWFMLFFLRCFFLSVSGEEEPTSLVEEELDTPSTAESARGEINKRCHTSQSLTRKQERDGHARGSPTLWPWLDSVDGQRCTPLLPRRKRGPPKPSISSTCRRLLALTGTAEGGGGGTSPEACYWSVGPLLCHARGNYLLQDNNDCLWRF